MAHILKERYQNEISPALMKSLNLDNTMQVPRIRKVIVNVGVGEALDNAKALDAVVSDIIQITGQKPIVTKARMSIANFKLREGRQIGVKVTLRGDRMWAFLDRLMNVALPRVRDFRGISSNAFDGRGNYTLGLREQLVFPEIEYDKIDKLRGMEISIVTTARNDEEGRQLLQMLGMPFRKEG
jgi:large subunit ribosomal protein L5